MSGLFVEYHPPSGEPANPVDFERAADLVRYVEGFVFPDAGGRLRVFAPGSLAASEMDQIDALRERMGAVLI